MEVEVLILNGYELKDKDFALVCYVESLEETIDEVDAIKELNAIIQADDVIVVEAETLVVKRVVRPPKLMQPNIYGKIIIMVFEELPHEEEYYFDKRFLLKTDK